jgi:hypothetical protein
MSPGALNPQTPPHFFPVVLISAAIVLLWLIPVFTRGGPAETAGAGEWGLVSIIALIFTIITPLAYGRYSGDGIGAILVGSVPFILTTGVSGIIAGNRPSGFDYLVCPVIYIVSLSMVGGLEGYFAAEKTPRSLLIAMVLAGIWTGIFFSGIR